LWNVTIANGIERMIDSVMANSLFNGMDGIESSQDVRVKSVDVEMSTD
jgi:hypothetical protein